MIRHPFQIEFDRYKELQHAEHQRNLFKAALEGIARPEHQWSVEMCRSFAREVLDTDPQERQR